MRIENVFELFIITDPGIFKDEEIYISELLELGASGIYIRKENYSAEYIWNIFKKVDNKFHHKLIVPFAFYAEHKIKNFDAIIHFKENERTKENFSKIQRDTIMSTSIHEINERISNVKIYNKPITPLDPLWTDIEIKDYWNEFFHKYGFLVFELIEKWDKLYLKGMTDEVKYKLMSNVDKFKTEKKIRYKD